jgi:hypothetical protein
MEAVNVVFNASLLLIEAIGLVNTFILAVISAVATLWMGRWLFKA